MKTLRFAEGEMRGAQAHHRQPRFAPGSFWRTNPFPVHFRPISGPERPQCTAIVGFPGPVSCT